MDTFSYIPFLRVRERTITVPAGVIEVAPPDATRIAIRFQLANFSGVDSIIGTNCRVSTLQEVDATSGYPVAMGLAQEFHFMPWGPAVVSRWWGILAVGVPRLTILETFWRQP